MPKVQVGNVGLYYEEHGAGEPLLLVPGFGTGLWIWCSKIAAHAAPSRFFAFDPRGVARSDKPDEAVSMRGYADDASALLEALNVERGHVLGASFGGFVPPEFALANPSRPRSLILCCTMFGGPRHCPPAPETLQAIASTKGLNTEERVRENLLLAFSPAFVANK